MHSRYLHTLLTLLLLALTAPFAAQAQETITYYHLDALGSPVAATDASGALLWRETYTPYGERWRAETRDHPAYTGKFQDPDLGLSYMGARWYDPRLGRFMGTDPAGFREDDVISFNRYAYGSNNPYGNLDPDGNIPIPVLVFGAYKLASLGYDAYSTYRTLSSADATTTDKALAVGGMAVGAVDPTGVSRHVRSMRQGGGVARGKGAPDFVVTRDGTAVPVSQSRMRQGFDDAGFPSRPSTKTSEPGVIHAVPTSKGPIDVRTMEGSAHHPRRAVTTTPGTNSPRTPSGGTPQGTKQQRRAASHFEQTP